MCKISFRKNVFEFIYLFFFFLSAAREKDSKIISDKQDKITGGARKLRISLFN